MDGNRVRLDRGRAFTQIVRRGLSLTEVSGLAGHQPHWAFLLLNNRRDDTVSVSTLRELAAAIGCEANDLKGD